ncbi:MAG: hypothetical protein IIV70_05045, partial [Peptococcaceae bacterium]|nr:hypothetical protein [Peptococcaceae bacterium]
NGPSVSFISISYSSLLKTHWIFCRIHSLFFTAMRIGSQYIHLFPYIVAGFIRLLTLSGVSHPVASRFILYKENPAGYNKITIKERRYTQRAIYYIVVHIF